MMEIWRELGIRPEWIAERGLPLCAEADCLVVAEMGEQGREHRLIPPAAEAWRSLKMAAADEGIELSIVSAFRSVARQTEILRGKLAAGLPIDDILAVCAPPGCSEHHTGRAVDICTPGVPPLSNDFAATPAFTWLNAHAAAFGFRLSYPPGNAQGFLYEPWHWCWCSTIR